MQAIPALWATLDPRRRMVVVGATLAMFVTILLLSRMAAAPQKALLYSGLDAAAAGDVVAALESRGIPYEVRGTAIHVPENQRDSLRLALAAEGLPAQGGAGYELLDTLTGFGTTAQMFDAAWARAIEGELARSILTNPQIRAARVHIARGSSQPFQPDAAPTASVAVTTQGGLTPDQARALRHLVAAAVTGMSPARVEVIDSVHGLIPVAGASPSVMGSDRAEEIRGNIERLLSARVGPGRAAIEVAVQVVTESELLSERRLDPEGRVAVSTETEVQSGSETAAGGQVTVASNLPDGQAAGQGDSGSTSEESRESVDYDVSETLREVTRAPGDIRRMTVAVLVDGEQVTAADGTVSWQPRSEEELAVLRELVAAAAGLDEARGDVLTLKSLEFRAAEALAEPAAAGLLAGLDLTRLMGLAVLAMVVLGLGLFVLRPALRAARQVQAEAQPLALPMGPLGDGPALTGEISDGFDIATLPMIGMDGDPDRMAEDPAARLRRLIEERQSESLAILRSWMEAGEERT